MGRPITRRPLYVAKTSAGIVEIVKIKQTQTLDIYVTHVMNNDWDTTLVRYDRRGEDGINHVQHGDGARREPGRQVRQMG